MLVVSNRSNSSRFRAIDRAAERFEYRQLPFQYRDDLAVYLIASKVGRPCHAGTVEISCERAAKRATWFR